MSTEMPLSELQPGQSGRIRRLQSSREFNRQLLRMGIAPGATLRFIRPAPLGDPLHYAAGNFELSLRRSTALQIQVEKVAE